MKNFHVHGDNIVECERTLSLILQALDLKPESIHGPEGIATCPRFHFNYGSSQEKFVFDFLPGYGRWNQDILAYIRNRGGKLREATDAILTQLNGDEEIPILALEYCGALPAGNQAWQRNGRAFSFGFAGVPFLYVAELGGYELDANRKRKAARLPNPAVPFSYVLLSIAAKEPTFPVFLRSPGAHSAAVKLFEPVYGETELLELIRCCILSKSTKTVKAALQTKVLELVKLLASSNGRKRSDTLSPAQWEAALAHVQSKNGDLVSFLVSKAPLFWSKTAYIEALTPSIKLLMTIASTMAVGLTSTKLPLCIIPSEKRKAFCKAVMELYPGISNDFISWLQGPGHLVICWVMGFKPRGDDARPDRGLPPLGRMLIGEDTNMLTVVYGPAPKYTWRMLKEEPTTLMERNGLWEAIIVTSDALLIDSDTAPHKPVPAYTKMHWHYAVKQITGDKLLVEAVPKKVGEQDVDTVLHLILGRISGVSVFEGLCNPPGGDWSGLSLLTHDRKLEFRWLGLPRVTAIGSKRPDHVFQRFDEKGKVTVVAIESKDAAADVEDGIGPRLTKYVLDLIASPPSVERANGTATWNHSTQVHENKKLVTSSIAAFVANNEGEVRQVAKRAGVDLVLGFAFSQNRKSCTIIGNFCNSSGEDLWNFISKTDCQQLSVNFQLLQ
jgi:hypothetical protein